MKALALVLVACGSAPSPAPIEGHAPQPVERTTPAPTIRWAERGFDTKAFPLIARGGEVAVFAVQDSDGGRGYPNLRIEVHDRNDRVIQKIDVMTSNDFEKLVVDDKATPELERRIAAANRDLAKLHGLHDLVAMQALEIQKPAGDVLPHLAIGENLDVDLGKNRLDIFRHNTERPFRSVDARAWQAASGARCAQENPAFLQAVYKASDINALVVEIAYRGTDTCWEPGNQLHLVSW